MASKRKRDHIPQRRDPFAFALATRTGNAAGSHKRKGAPKGSRKQQNDAHVRNAIHATSDL